MPIYEYSCQKCKAHTEIMQKMTDKPLTKCQKCGGKLEKEWSQTSFQLKGSGWYVTDYAAKKGGEAKEPSEKKTETKAETKSDSKPPEPAKTTESASSNGGDQKKSKKPAAPTSAPKE